MTWEENNIDQSWVPIPRFENIVFKSPFLRFSAIHIPLAQPGHPLSTWSLYHPWVGPLNSVSFKGGFQQILIISTERTPLLRYKLSVLQSGEFTCSMRMVILIICYYSLILTTTVCSREGIKFILEMKIPKLIAVKGFAQGQTGGRRQSWDSDVFHNSGHFSEIYDIFKHHFLDNYTILRGHEPCLIMQKQWKDNQRIPESFFYLRL